MEGLSVRQDIYGILRLNREYMLFGGGVSDEV